MREQMGGAQAGGGGVLQGTREKSVSRGHA